MYGEGEEDEKRDCVTLVPLHLSPSHPFMPIHILACLYSFPPPLQHKFDERRRLCGRVSEGDIVGRRLTRRRRKRHTLGARGEKKHKQTHSSRKNMYSPVVEGDAFVNFFPDCSLANFTQFVFVRVVTTEELPLVIALCLIAINRRFS